MATHAPAWMGSWADLPWRGETSQGTDSICPRCGAPAKLQEPVRSWTRDGGWVEQRAVQCRGTARREVPTNKGSHQFGRGRTATVRGCGLVPIETRAVEAPPPAVVENEKLKEELTMPRGTLTPQPAREELYRRVRAGEHPTDVGKDLGIHESTAADLVRREGIDYQRRDAIAAMAKGKRDKLPTDLVTEGIRLCLDEGMTVMDAGEKVGVNFRSLKQYVTRARREREAASTAPVVAVADPEPRQVTAETPGQAAITCQEPMLEEVDEEAFSAAEVRSDIRRGLGAMSVSRFYALDRRERDAIEILMGVA